MKAPWPNGQDLKASTLRSGVQIPDNAISTGRGLGFNSRKGELCRKLEKMLTTDLSMAQGVPSIMDLVGLLRVMQSGVNPHKTGRIVGYNIVYIMVLIICNSIINQTKKKEQTFLFIPAILFPNIHFLYVPFVSRMVTSQTPCLSIIHVFKISL